MRPADTSPDAHDVQIAAYRRMGPSGRLRVGLELSALSRELCATGIRRRHPEYDDAQVRLALIRLLLGPALFRAAYPDAPELAA